MRIGSRATMVFCLMKGTIGKRLGRDVAVWRFALLNLC